MTSLSFVDFRRWFCWPAVVAGALLSLLTVDAFAEKRVALVIGNSAYKNVVKLANPTNDAASVAALLKSSGFDVVEAKDNLTNRDMRRAVRDFTEVTRDADIAVVYYAGHGIEVGGTNYLIPIDAVLERDIDVIDEALPLDRLVNAIESARNLRLVILDACRDNPFSKTIKRTIASRSIGRGLAEVDPSVGNTLIAFAAKAGSTASDGSASHSPFTAALLEISRHPASTSASRLAASAMKFMPKPAGRNRLSTARSVAATSRWCRPSRSLGRIHLSMPSFVTISSRATSTRLRRGSFMAAHPKSGFYYNLAKAARDKAAATALQVRNALDARRKAAEEAKTRAANEAKQKFEAEAKAQAEAESKLVAEAKLKAEAEARRHTEAKARAEAELKLKAEAEIRHKAEIEKKTRAEAEARRIAELKEASKNSYRGRSTRQTGRTAG